MSGTDTNSKEGPHRAAEHPATVEETLAVVATTKRSAQALLDDILSVQVQDNASMHKASGLLLEIKAQQKTAKSLKDEALTPFKAVIKYVSALFTEPEGLLEAGEQHLKDQIKTYREAAEAQHAAALEAAQSPEDVAAAVAVIPDKPQGISERVMWKYRVVDESKIPDEYWVLDEQRLGREARMHKEDLCVPGVEPVREVTMVARSK